VPQKLFQLRRSGTCRVCSGSLDQGVMAWWDSASHSLECTTCHPGAALESNPSSVSESGIPGGSSLERYETLHAKREAAIERRWGRFAGVVKLLTDDPQSTRAWRSGSEGERKLANYLTERLGGRVVLLHDRRVPRTRGNIDHLVVAASGVWVIDAKLRKGLIELRDVGGWFKVDRQLYVGGRRQTKLVDGIGWQVEAVRNALGTPGVPVHSAVCFVDGEWKLFAKPFELNGVLVCWPTKLVEKISQDGALEPAEVLAVAGYLASSLPARASPGPANTKN
jgi:hypothetical protein